MDVDALACGTAPALVHEVALSVVCGSVGLWLIHASNEPVRRRYVGSR